MKEKILPPQTIKPEGLVENVISATGEQIPYALLSLLTGGMGLLSKASIGHPVGASGARVLTTLLHEMKRSGAKKGLATLCIGGGQGVALAIERA